MDSSSSNSLSVSTTYRGSIEEQNSPSTPSKRRPSPLKPVTIIAGKDTEELKDEETQADALLRSKRERAKKRQTMPEGAKIQLNQ